MDNAFIRDYPSTYNAVLAERYGVARVTIVKWAKKLGLRKSPAHFTEKQRLNATGKKKSPETREHIRVKAIGRKISPDTIAKIVSTKRERGTLPRGENHPAWRGGKPWERFKNPAYRAWRNAVLARDDYVCQDCGRQCYRREKGLAAHHLNPYATHPELRFTVDNGITLCRSCHMRRHGKEFIVEMIPCACGCGTLIASKDRYGRPRRFVNFHARFGRCRG